MLRDLWPALSSLAAALSMVAAHANLLLDPGLGSIDFSYSHVDASRSCACFVKSGGTWSGPMTLRGLGLSRLADLHSRPPGRIAPSRRTSTPSRWRLARASMTTSARSRGRTAPRRPSPSTIRTSRVSTLAAPSSRFPTKHACCNRILTHTVALLQPSTAPATKWYVKTIGERVYALCLCRRLRSFGARPGVFLGLSVK